MTTIVEKIMISDIKTVRTDGTVLQAVEVMNKHEIGSVVVIDGTRPVGILTERDILKRIVFKRKDPSKTRISEVMSKPLVTVKKTTDVCDAAKKMLQKGVKKLVVVNNGHLQGIVSLTDMLPSLENQRSIDEHAIQRASKHIQRAFQIYYDPVRQLRKTCPLTMSSGMPISCLGMKCMWYVSDACVFLGVIQKMAT